MSIKFLIHESGQYFTPKFEDLISDAELVSSYEKFYDSYEKSASFCPGLHELCDLTGADLSQLTSYGLKALSDWAEEFYKMHGVTEKRTAILLSPEAQSVSAVFYEFWTEASPEYVKIFRNQTEAIKWLTE
ncbi:MAG: hypothetical protein GY707_04915 [Desulfobacteraceae bacterium]|nr:hypothetical protein [Desulfobacteraceae bacterium]